MTAAVSWPGWGLIPRGLKLRGSSYRYSVTSSEYTEGNKIQCRSAAPSQSALRAAVRRYPGRTGIILARLVGLAEGYEKRVKEETELTKDQLKTRYVGKLDPKKHIEDVGQQLIEDNIVSVSRQMIDKEASVAKPNGGTKGHQAGSMEIDEEL